MEIPRLCLTQKCFESCLVHSIPCTSCDLPEKLFCTSKVYSSTTIRLHTYTLYTTFHAEMSRQSEKNARYMTAEFLFILKFACSWLYLRLVSRTWHRYLREESFSMLHTNQKQLKVPFPKLFFFHLGMPFHLNKG